MVDWIKVVPHGPGLFFGLPPAPPNGVLPSSTATDCEPPHLAHLNSKVAPRGSWAASAALSIGGPFCVSITLNTRRVVNLHSIRCLSCFSLSAYTRDICYITPLMSQHRHAMS